MRQLKPQGKWLMCTNREDKIAMPVTVEKLYERFEDREANRRGLSLLDVRPIIARVIGVSPGTLTNLKRKRLKRSEHLKDAITSAFIRSLEAEIAHISHEIELLRQGGARPDSDEVLEAETLLRKAKELIRQ
jgi:hypothetical protein